ATVEIAGGYAAYHGDDRYRETVDRLQRVPGVVIRGPLAHAEVPGFLAGLDALAVPSIWPENSPLVIREAFLAGVPVIGSRIGGIPEAVHDGLNGLLFEPGDVAALRAAIGRLVEEPGLLERLRHGARESAVRPLADDVQATERLYDSLRADAGAAAPARLA